MDQENIPPDNMGRLIQENQQLLALHAQLAGILAQTMRDNEELRTRIGNRQAELKELEARKKEREDKDKGKGNKQ